MLRLARKAVQNDGLALLPGLLPRLPAFAGRVRPPLVPPQEEKAAGSGGEGENARSLMQIAIIGLPYSGKTTLFEAITGTHGAAGGARAFRALGHRHGAR